MNLTTLRLTAFAFAALLLAAPALAGDPPENDWAQWRGPNRDNLSPDTGLLKSWPKSGPPLAWRAKGIGSGYSAVSISGGRVYTMGEFDGKTHVIALNEADGKTVWSTPIGEPGGNRGAGPRSTPATDGKLVFAIGQAGELVCLSAEDGKVVWKKHLIRDFGGRRPNWWFSESPLLDGDSVVCTPGGSRGTVLALKKESGTIAWQSSGLTDRTDYTSLVPVEIGGVRQYLVFTVASVAGIAPKDGKVLWRAARKGQTAICSSPLYQDEIVFVSSAYSIGCNAFKVTASGGSFNVEEIYAGKQIQSHHGGMVLLDGYVYGLDGAGLKCIELKTGKVVWQNQSVGKGSIAYADGHLICRNEGPRPGRRVRPGQLNGQIALVEATPSGYKEKGRFDQPDRHELNAWAHPVVFGGKLYIRDQDLLLCYDLKAK